MSIINRLPKVDGQYREDVDTSKFCWFKVGGAAAVLYKPKSVADLQYFIANLPTDIPYFILGAGSNVIIQDHGFEGIIIRLGREFNYINKIDATKFEVGASTLDYNIATVACDSNIAGLEFFSGIPGTFGGAIAMNAGAYGTEVKDVLISARAINSAGELKTFSNAEIGFSYRNKTLGDEWIFIDGIIEGVVGDKNIITDQIKAIQSARSHTQPINQRTGGSTFKNPATGPKAWQLIDQAGCRGMSIGGAQVSQLHCNFFINTGDATASDIINLIHEVKTRVFQASGVALQEEIKVVG